jgi:hypothetical protein
MKLPIKHLTLPLLVLSLFVYSSCETDDDPVPEQFEVSYDIDEHEESGVFGTITFRKEGEASTFIRVEMDGTQTGGVHPVRIHSTDPEFTGPPVLELPPVDGGTGLSEALITETADGTPITYEDWVSYDGYVVVYRSAEAMEPLAIGLIGSTDPNIPGGL